MSNTDEFFKKCKKVKSVQDVRDLKKKAKILYENIGLVIEGLSILEELLEEQKKAVVIEDNT